jgi:septal ring factor EnvC (AmiA/AmiB activator)
MLVEEVRFQPRAEIREQRAESREQRAESREQRAESREQRAESREQRAKSREQRAEKTICRRPIEQQKTRAQVQKRLQWDMLKEPLLLPDERDLRELPHDPLLE